MQTDINRAAKSARKSFKEQMPTSVEIIDINHGIPYVGIDLANGDEYFFQGQEASELLEQATTTSNKFNTNLEDTLLWMAQSW